MADEMRFFISDSGSKFKTSNAEGLDTTGLTEVTEAEHDQYDSDTCKLNASKRVVLKTALERNTDRAKILPAPVPEPEPGVKS